jgi:hypothetical protein
MQTSSSDAPGGPSQGARGAWLRPTARRLGTVAELTLTPKTLGTTDSVFYDDVGLVPGDPLS